MPPINPSWIYIIKVSFAGLSSILKTLAAISAKSIPYALFYQRKMYEVYPAAWLYQLLIETLLIEWEINQ
jgi:hypothetical protein